MSAALVKIAYCSSTRHARAAVKALTRAGYTAQLDREGYILANADDNVTWTIATDAIKALK